MRNLSTANWQQMAKEGLIVTQGCVTMWRPLSQGCKQWKPHDHMDETFLGNQTWLLLG